MLKSSWILFSALISYSAFGVSFQEKEARIEFLEDLNKKVTFMNINAYRRELQYEKQNLTLDQRAENEANLLVEQVRVQVMRSYEAALLDKSPADAENEVRGAIEKDLKLIDQNLREEIRDVAFKALDDAQLGSLSSHYDVQEIEKSMLKRVKERHAYLNETGSDFGTMALINNLPSANKSKDAERKEYPNKNVLLESLVSDRDSTRWVSTSNSTLKSQVMRKSESKANFQIKASFLGVEIDAGATIAFKREFNTNVYIMSEGMSPVIFDDGNFDYFKRDKNGRVIKKNGVPQRRFVTFSCEVVLEFETDYVGEGSFSVSGGPSVPGVGGASIGGSVSQQETKQYSDSVNLSSRRLLVPEYVGGKTVTYKDLQNLCHEDFLNTRITNTLTVKDSLNLMMKNVISSITFSHPKTKCATDQHCIHWFDKEIIGLVKIGNIPRCIEEKRGKYRACELRGLEGQNCAVFENGKRTSDGSFEFVCDKGFKCMKTRNAGWFQNWSIYEYAKGKCVKDRTGYIKII